MHRVMECPVCDRLAARYQNLTDLHAYLSGAHCRAVQDENMAGALPVGTLLFEVGGNLTNAREQLKTHLASHGKAFTNGNGKDYAHMMDILERPHLGATA